MATETVVAGPSTLELPVEADEASARPTERLPVRQLLQLSVYWLGINSIMGGLGVVVQKRIPRWSRHPGTAPRSRSRAS